MSDLDFLVHDLWLKEVWFLLEGAIIWCFSPVRLYLKHDITIFMSRLNLENSTNPKELASVTIFNLAELYQVSPAVDSAFDSM